jgi:O-antigen ligase
MKNCQPGRRKQIPKSIYFASEMEDRVLFLLVCLYWLSQSFLVPLAPIGPSWAVWPSLSDLVVVALAPLVLSPLLRKAPQGPASAIVKLAWTALILSIVSFLIATSCYGRHDEFVTIGGYQIFRTMQYMVVLLATAQMVMTWRRWAVLRGVALSAFLMISAGVLLVACGRFPANTVTPLLPPSPVLAGPWGAYVCDAQDLGGGFISYNHGYSGIQLILSAGVAYLCFEQSRRIRLLICSLLALSTLVSGSRVCFITALVLIGLLEWRRTSSNLLPLVLLFGLGGLWAVQSSSIEDAIERQSSSVSSIDDDGLSGRTGIWQEHLEYFAKHPQKVLFGTGYGYAGKASFDNAHNLYLHVMTETGVAGLIFFLQLQRRILLLLGNHRLRTIRLTYWALLFTGLTQETLYPTAAFSHFVGYCLSAVVIAILFASIAEFSTASVTRKPAAHPICEATA